MVRGAMRFLHGRSSDSYDTTRFDVLSVSWTRDRLVVEHIEDAFPADRSGTW